MSLGDYLRTDCHLTARLTRFLGRPSSGQENWRKVLELYYAFEDQGTKGHGLPSCMIIISIPPVTVRKGTPS
jgi:hypothetical protein